MNYASIFVIEQTPFLKLIGLFISSAVVILAFVNEEKYYMEIDDNDEKSSLNSDNKGMILRQLSSILVDS